MGGNDQIPLISGTSVPARRDLQPGIAPFAHHGQHKAQRRDLQHADVILPADVPHRHFVVWVEHIIRDLDLARPCRRQRLHAFRQRFRRGFRRQASLQLFNSLVRRLLRTLFVIDVIGRKEKSRCDQQQPKADQPSPFFTFHRQCFSGGSAQARSAAGRPQAARAPATKAARSGSAAVCRSHLRPMGCRSLRMCWSPQR